MGTPRTETMGQGRYIHGSNRLSMRDQNLIEVNMPSGPAFFTKFDLMFCLHVVAYRLLGGYRGVVETFHEQGMIFEYNITNQLKLLVYNDWKSAVEDIVKNCIPNTSHRGLFAQRNNYNNDEEYENAIMGQLEGGIIVNNPYAELRMNGKFGGRFLANGYREHDGYIIESDLLRGEQEIVIFTAGMNKFTRFDKANVVMSHVGRTNQNWNGRKYQNYSLYAERLMEREMFFTDCPDVQNNPIKDERW